MHKSLISSNCFIKGGRYKAKIKLVKHCSQEKGLVSIAFK